MTTIQEVVDLSRLDLQDDEKVRWTDVVLLAHANRAIMVFVQKRPDLFIGQYDSLPNGTFALGDTFPLDAIYVKPCADMVNAFAQTKDDEALDEQRVNALFTRAVSLMT